ncbi:MAG: alpha-E domain-containing protein [Cellvibrionales bacterium]|nr:alpha-E domain-containing protein [Cellvibrionales bacterium]
MLSRVAERIYWTARYLDRIENTARLIDVYHKLMLDLPLGASFSWYGLITLNQSETLFKKSYKNEDERSIIKFFLGDKQNPSSIISSLKQVRENIRTTRDTLPEFIWILINEMSLFVEKNLHQGINRNQRIEFLDGIIHSCFQIKGLLLSTMPMSDAWYFMVIGRKIERADMTTRLLYAGAKAHFQLEEQGPTINSHQLVWGNILQTLGALQAYRKATRYAVVSEKVVHYLLEDPYLPSSISHCIHAIHTSCDHLPKKKPVIDLIESVEKNLFRSMNYRKLEEPFREYLHRLQLQIAKIHQGISDNWFPQYENDKYDNDKHNNRKSENKKHTHEQLKSNG